ncbi:MAG: spore germination protein [Paenibacillus sp.]|jgi:spore germination protein KB|nr:spore germination protein [Paenibacillus sp.]
MDSIKISPTQALMLGISGITVTGHLLFIPVLLNHAGRDSWLSLLCAAAPALFIGYVISHLAQMFPGKTIVDYSRILLGKWIGTLVGGIFIFYIFHDATLSIRGFGEFFTSAITPTTPIMIYFSAIVILAVYAVRSGLEVIVRTNQVFLISIIPVGILASILTHKDKDYLNFLPVLEFGPEPMLMGSFTLVSLYSSFSVLSFVFPFLSQSKKIKRYSVLTMLLIILMFIGPVTGPVAIFGAERSAGLSFPTFQMLRDIKVGQLQRLDLLGIILWSLGSFSKIALYLFAACIGTARWFRLDDYRVLAAPMGALMVIVALINSKNFVEIYRFLKDSYPYYSTTVGLIFPLLLLLTAYLRRFHKLKGE